MRIQRDTASYNDRRYGRPYIAKIDFATDPKGAAAWGQWVGQPGEEGILVLDANPGDIVMTGQKDFRNARNSSPDYWQVLSDGELDGPITKALAYTRATQARGEA